MTLREDIQSEDMSLVLKGLDDLEVKLRQKHDYSDLLDSLVNLSVSDNSAIIRKVTWCAAKMGQNKINDLRIISLLASLANSDDEQVRENVAWGIGETAGTVALNNNSINAISLLLDDPERDVRGMAAWAAGRFHRKCGYITDEIKTKLKTLLEDPSEYVRSAAKFALEI